MKIKVCGLKSSENVLAVESLGIDMVGFIFYPGSKRYAGDQEPVLTSRVQRVGVFVNATTIAIREMAQKWQLDFLQLHGDESPDDCRILRAMGLPLVKAFAVDQSFDFGVLKNYQDSVDYFLFDTKGAEYGGNGYRFEWKLLDQYDLDVPFWLSGGIGPEMAAEIKALKLPGLVAIDLNSRFEEGPGKKNIEKLKTFVDELQS